MTSTGDSGITAQAANAGMRAIMGATRKRNLLEFVGMTTSLVRSLKTSANGWPSPGKRPKMRTRFGPRRSCIQPMTLRSQSVSKATQMIRATVTITIHTVVRTMPGSDAQAMARFCGMGLSVGHRGRAAFAGSLQGRSTAHQGVDLVHRDVDDVRRGLSARVPRDRVLARIRQGCIRGGRADEHLQLRPHVLR